MPQRNQIISAQQGGNVESNASTDTASTLETLGFTVSRTVNGGGTHAQSEYAEWADVYVETNAVRFGTGSPTTSLGILANPDEVIHLESEHEVKKPPKIHSDKGAAHRLGALAAAWNFCIAGLNFAGLRGRVGFADLSHP